MFAAEPNSAGAQEAARRMCMSRGGQFLLFATACGWTRLPERVHHPRVLHDAPEEHRRSAFGNPEDVEPGEARRARAAVLRGARGGARAGLGWRPVGVR